MERSDEEVMMDYQSGNDDAIHQLFHRYKARLFHFCLGILGNLADAEDVAADVFVALVAQRNGYHAGHTFSTWVYTIARNKCVDRIRRRRLLLPLFVPRQERGQDDEAILPVDPASSAESALETLAQKEVVAQVRDALSRLPYEQRAAITLKQYHDCSYEQISEILTCSLAKVKILIFRGKERLRTELAALAKEIADERA